MSRSHPPEPGGACQVRHTMGALLAIVVYVALHATHSPPFVYLPVEHRIVAAAPEGAIGMGLYGYMAGGLLGYAVGHLIGRWRWLQAPPRTGALRVALLAATLGALAWFVIAELAHASGAS